ncbi:MAG: magnesium/cobalt transporter CorA [Thermoplasmata archaeon]
MNGPGNNKGENTTFCLYRYNESEVHEKETKKVPKLDLKDGGWVYWVNICGIHDKEKIEEIGEEFGLHPLVVEDILTTNQRPKIEEFDDYLLIVLKMIYWEEGSEDITSEHVSLILGDNYVISFQMKEGDVFDSVRDRIKTGKGRIRNMGADYLAYALLDSVVDGYFVTLERTGEKVEDIEVNLMDEPEEDTLYKIHGMKRSVIHIRRAVWPLRDVVNTINRGESDLITEDTSIFFRDIYDHTIQVIDTVETYRDMLSSLLDLYLSSLSNKMNEVMKVLTIIATIFIPLTFIAGVYGMNFSRNSSKYNMPELYWTWGYPATLTVMFIISIIMVIYFKKKDWL